MIEYNPRSWFDTICRWRGSVVPEVLPHMLQTGLVAMLVWYLDAHGVNCHIEKTGHSMFGFFVTFLVIFRVNNAVHGFARGEQLLEEFHETACEIMRHCMPKARGATVVPLLRRQVLQTAGLMIMHLRDENVLDGLQHLREAKLLTEKEASVLEAVVRRERFPSRRSRDFSTVALTLLTAELWRHENEGTLASDMRKSIDSCVSTLHHITHATDSIKCGQIPFQYVQMQRLFMVIFLYTVPCALVQSLRATTIPVTMILTFGYVGLDKTGDSLEDPFGDDLADLPLVSMLRKMETSTRRIVDARFGAGVAEAFDFSPLKPDAGDDGEPDLLDGDVNGNGLMGGMTAGFKSSAVVQEGGYQPIAGGGGSDLLGLGSNEA